MVEFRSVDMETKDLMLALASAAVKIRRIAQDLQITLKAIEDLGDLFPRGVVGGSFDPEIRKIQELDKQLSLALRILQAERSEAPGIDGQVQAAPEAQD